jgi:hypothetical protein
MQPMVNESEDPEFFGYDIESDDELQDEFLYFMEKDD